MIRLNRHDTPRIRYGNCWLGAITLMIRLRTVEITWRWSMQAPLPHFFVGGRRGWWHFKRVRDVLPWPFSYLCFVGRFQCIRRLPR